VNPQVKPARPLRMPMHGQPCAVGTQPLDHLVIYPRGARGVHVRWASPPCDSIQQAEETGATTGGQP
jgi:hypothetical protein